jgi:hypothetical protein
MTSIVSPAYGRTVLYKANFGRRNLLHRSGRLRIFPTNLRRIKTDPWLICPARYGKTFHALKDRFKRQTSGG